MPSAPTNRPSGGDRPSVAGGGSASQLPSGNRPGNAERPSQKPARPETRPGDGVAQRPSQQPARPGGAERPAQLPAKPGAGAGFADRPGGKPSQRPSTGDVGNFLGVAGGVAAGGALGNAIANRPTQLPANRPGAGQRPAGPVQRPEQRPDWSQRSQNRNDQWQQRVDNRHDSWNNWEQKNQDRLNNFQSTRDQRWDQLQGAQENRQNWRDQNREDWQGHRQDMWNYRTDRADEIRGNARDFYDDRFDDRWWGACRWGVGFGYVGFGNYPANPWWWWRPAAWGVVSTFVNAITPDPVYIDYGMNVIYEGQTVYVDNQPIPAAQYTEPIVNLAVNAELPPPPTPPAEGQQPEWLPLGVFALAQEEKGDPIMFIQLSVNRAGVISGAYNSTLTDDQRPIAGQVDKATQQVAWRIGANTDTIFVTSLANLTQDVSPVAIHFGSTRTQTWLLVRMPEPAPAGQPANIPEIDRKPPPLNSAKPKSGN
ncbi:MAG: mu-protocadherin-cell-suface protein [Chthoniobacter sp.]|nr:mu-protocadherin-cell-suface protein [Chthoniobacter sp.]